MASCRTKTIEEIDDLMEMFKVTEALGISCSGLKTLDEMKAKVKEELNPSVDKPSWTAGQVRMRQKCYFWFSRDVRKLKLKILSFHRHEVKVIFKHISAGLSSAR